MEKLSESKVKLFKSILFYVGAICYVVVTLILGVASGMERVKKEKVEFFEIRLECGEKLVNIEFTNGFGQYATRKMNANEDAKEYPMYRIIECKK